MKDQYPTKNIIPPEAANTNPVTAGRIVGLPEGSLVHVNVNGNLIPVRTVAAPMTNVQTSVQDPAYTTTTVPFQITTSVIQACFRRRKSNSNNKNFTTKNSKKSICSSI